MITNKAKQVDNDVKYWIQNKVILIKANQKEIWLNKGSTGKDGQRAFSVNITNFRTNNTWKCSSRVISTNIHDILLNRTSLYFLLP